MRYFLTRKLSLRLQAMRICRFEMQRIGTRFDPRWIADCQLGERASAFAQSTKTYDLGGGRIHIREKVDLLHPTHEPADELQRFKKTMGSMLFSAQ
jgi:hypothetical protein